MLELEQTEGHAAACAAAGHEVLETPGQPDQELLRRLEVALRRPGVYILPDNLHFFPTPLLRKVYFFPRLRIILPSFRGIMSFFLLFIPQKGLLSHQRRENNVSQAKN